MSGVESVLRDGLLAGEVVLITGGGSGIGKRLAHVAGRVLGAKVALCGRREEQLREVGGELEACGVPVIWQRCDIRNDQEVELLVRTVLAKWGRIDVLINNAGGQYRTAAEDCKPKGFEAVVRNNLLGTWRVTYYVVNLAMIPAQRGSIVNMIAQIRNGFPGMIHTGAARAGVDNFTKTAAVEWAPYNIRVNAIAPGAIGAGSGTDRYPPEVMELARQTQPMKRLGTIEEVTDLTLFVASNRASGYTTGQTFYVDGGQSLSSGLWANAKL